MVNIPLTPRSIASTSPLITKARAVEPVTKIEAERKANEQPFVERRKSKDRRKYSAARGPYDFRCGRDRRKNSRKGRFVETEA